MSLTGCNSYLASDCVAGSITRRHLFFRGAHSRTLYPMTREIGYLGARAPLGKRRCSFLEVQVHQHTRAARAPESANTSSTKGTIASWVHSIAEQSKPEFQRKEQLCRSLRIFSCFCKSGVRVSACNFQLSAQKWRVHGSRMLKALWAHRSAQWLLWTVSRPP